MRHGAAAANWRPAGARVHDSAAMEIERFVPDAATVVLLAPIGLAVAAAAGGLAGWLRAARGVAAPYTRKVFHFAIFTAAATVHLWRGPSGVVVFGAVVALVVVSVVARGEGHALYEALARPTDAPHRTLFVLVPLATTALGGILANVLSPGYGYVGYLVAGWGDALGEPVGTRWGRHRYRVPTLAGVPAWRSLEGSTAVLLGGFAAALVGLLIAGVAPGPAAKAAALAAVAGTVVEAASSHGIDNLTVQAAAALVARLALG